MKIVSIVAQSFMLISFLIILVETKFQERATVDANDDDDDNIKDEEDYSAGDGDTEVDDDGKIYKNPRNSPSVMCPRDETKAEFFGQRCLRKCSTDEDCKSKKKKCRCDSLCGMSCIKPERECPALKEINYGQMTVTGKFFGDTVDYVCDPGYTIVGSPRRSCRADGFWSGTIPACKRGTNSFCIEPPVMANAKHNVPPEQSTFDIDAEVQYFCDEGYETTGFQKAKCLIMDEKTSWFGPDITCNPKSCGVPTDIPNGWHAGKKNCNYLLY